MIENATLAVYTVLRIKMLHRTNSQTASGNNIETFTKDAEAALGDALLSVLSFDSDETVVFALKGELQGAVAHHMLSQNFQYGNQIISELIKGLDVKCPNLRIIDSVLTSTGRNSLSLEKAGYTAFIGYEDGHFFPVLIDHTDPNNIKVYNGDSKVPKTENTVESFLSEKFKDEKKKALASKMNGYQMKLYHTSELFIHEILQGKTYQIKNNEEDVQKGEGCGPYCVEVIKKIAAQSSLTGLCSALMSGDKELFDSANSAIGRFTQIRNLLSKFFSSLSTVTALDDIKTPMDLLLSTVKEEHRAEVVSTLYELGLGGRNEIEPELFHNIVKNLNVGRILKEEDVDLAQTKLGEHIARIHRKNPDNMYCGM